MSNQTRQARSRDSAVARQRIKILDRISSGALMLGLGLVFALALALRFGFPPHDDTVAVSSGLEAEAARASFSKASPDGQRSDGFRSQRRPVGQAEAEPKPKGSDRSVSTLPALVRLEQSLANAGPREQQAAAALKRFAMSGAMSEIRSIDREDVVALAKRLSTELSPAEAGDLLHGFLGLSAPSLKDPEDVSSAVVEIFDAVAGNRTDGVRPSVLMITDEADVDGRITGRTHVLPAGSERAYAVFENAHALAGLDQVLAVWRNPSDDRMVFTEFEPIRQGSAYNYVWLKVDSGWPEGQYQVELFDPEAQSLLLASETFTVR